MNDPFPLRTLTLSSGEVRYLDFGEGPPLLLVHGYPGRPQDFRSMLPYLHEFRVLAPGMPGMGLTPISTEPAPSLDGRARFLGTFLDALGVDEVVVAGHSMGAGLSLLLASSQPDRVRRLAMIAPIGVRPYRGYRLTHAQVMAPLMSYAPLRPITAPVLRASFRMAGFPRGLSDETLRHTLWCVAAMDFSVIAAGVIALRAPTLIAMAEDDEMIESPIVDELAERCPTGPRLRFGTGGHALIKTRAQAVGEALAIFAAGTE